MKEKIRATRGPLETLNSSGDVNIYRVIQLVVKAYTIHSM